MYIFFILAKKGFNEAGYKKTHFSFQIKSKPLCISIKIFNLLIEVLLLQSQKEMRKKKVKKCTKNWPTDAC